MFYFRGATLLTAVDERQIMEQALSALWELG